MQNKAKAAQEWLENNVNILDSSEFRWCDLKTAECTDSMAELTAENQDENLVRSSWQWWSVPSGVVVIDGEVYY